MHACMQWRSPLLIAAALNTYQVLSVIDFLALWLVAESKYSIWKTTVTFNLDDYLQVWNEKR